MHTGLGLYVPVWQALLDHANLVRAKQGGPPLPPAVDSWTAQSKLLVASWAQFDCPPRSARGRALYVICHAGHGTTTAALSHGVPLVCIPGLGRDQAPIAARVAELGLGIALDEAAPRQHIADAVHTILADSSYRRRTHRFSKRVAARPDGAERAADELERLLDHPAPGDWPAPAPPR